MDAFLQRFYTFYYWSHNVCGCRQDNRCQGGFNVQVLAAGWRIVSNLTTRCRLRYIQTLSFRFQQECDTGVARYLCYVCFHRNCFWEWTPDLQRWRFQCDGFIYVSKYPQTPTKRSSYLDLLILVGISICKYICMYLMILMTEFVLDLHSDLHILSMSS